MAFYDNNGNLAVNETYFDSKKMNDAYDACVDSGFHPSRGNKSGMEAVVAHEMGHRLNHIAAGGSWDNLRPTAYNIVKEAARKSGFGTATQKFVAQISGYAKGDYAESIAEAFSDVWCNGNRANSASQAIVTELNTYFNR